MLLKEKLLNKFIQNSRSLRTGLGKVLDNSIVSTSLIFENWEVFLSFIFLIACIFFHVNPFYTLQEIGDQQEFVQFHNKLGTQYLFDNKPDAARIEFNKVLTVDPSNAEATSKLIDCDIASEIKSDTYDQNLLKIQLNMLLEEDPNDPFPYYFIGNLYLNDNDLTNAELYTREAISKDELFADAYNNLGLIYDKQNDPINSLNYFKAAYNLSNGNAVYASNVAETYYDLKEYENARDWFEEAVSIDPMCTMPYFYYPNTLRILDDLENASEVQEEQISLLEDNGTRNISYNDGSYYYRIHSGDSVYLDNYDERKIYAYYNLALTYYLRENETKALDSLKKANDIKIDKNSKLDVLRLLHYNVEDLQTAQPKYISKITKFQNIRSNL